MLQFWDKRNYRKIGVLLHFVFFIRVYGHGNILLRIKKPSLFDSTLEGASIV